MSRLRFVLPLLACWLASAGAALAWHRQASLLDAEVAATAAQVDALQSSARQLTAELAAANRYPQHAAAPSDPEPAGLQLPAAQVARVLALLRGAEVTHGVRWRTLSLGRSGALPAPANPLLGPPPGQAGAPAGATAATLATATIGPMSPTPPAGGAVLAARSIDTLFAQPAALPGMRVATLSAAGEYRSLAQLQALLDALIRDGAALTELTLEEDRIQLTALLINLHR
jgi:hypothetical protein